MSGFPAGGDRGAHRSDSDGQQEAAAGSATRSEPQKWKLLPSGSLSMTRSTCIPGRGARLSLEARAWAQPGKRDRTQRLQADDGRATEETLGLTESGSGSHVDPARENRGCCCTQARLYCDLRYFAAVATVTLLICGIWAPLLGFLSFPGEWLFLLFHLLFLCLPLPLPLLLLFHLLFFLLCFHFSCSSSLWFFLLVLDDDNT